MNALSVLTPAPFSVQEGTNKGQGVLPTTSRAEWELLRVFLSCHVSADTAGHILRLLQTPGFNAADVRARTFATLVKCLDERADGTLQSENMGIPMDGEQEVVFYWRCPRQAVLEILQDNRLADRLYLYAARILDAQGRAVVGPANTGQKWMQDQAILPGTCLAQVVIGSDGTIIRKRLGIHPIILCLANVPEWLRAFPAFWHLVGLIPTLRRSDGRYADPTQFRRRKRLLLAACISKIETLVTQAVVDGVRLQWWQSAFNVKNGDSVTRRWVMTLFNNPSDEEEAQDSTFRYSFTCGQATCSRFVENGARVLPVQVCLLRAQDLQASAKRGREVGTYGDNDEWQGKIKAARPIFAQESDFGSGLPPHVPPPLQSAERYHHFAQVVGTYPDRNPLHDVQGTGDEHSRRPPDPMHMVELGIMVRVLNAIILALRMHEGLDQPAQAPADPEDDHADSSDSEDELAGAGAGGGAGGARAGGAVARTKVIWKEVEDRLRLLGVRPFARNAFHNGLVHGMDDKGQIKMGLTAAETTQLFLVMPSALACLPLSRPGGAAVLSRCLQALGAVSVWYFHATAPAMTVEDLPSLQDRGVALLATLQDCFEGVHKFETPKGHMLFHVVGSGIIPFGAWYNSSAEVLELKHVLLKRLSNNTNRQPGWQQFVLRNHVRMEEHAACTAEMARPEFEQVFAGEEPPDDAGDDDDNWGAWQGWEDQRGNSLAIDHASSVSARLMRSPPAFPTFEAALDRQGTSATLHVRMRHPSSRQRGSDRHIGLPLLSVLDELDYIKVLTAQHVNGPECLHMLPGAMARHLCATATRGTSAQDLRNANHLQTSRVRTILSTSVLNFPGIRPAGEPCAPIQVWTQIEIRNPGLTGGPALWGDVRDVRDQAQIVRCCPFTCAKFHGRNPSPCVAFVPYASLGPTGEDGAPLRPTLGGARVERLLHPDGDSGVCFGRVLLLFKAFVQVSGRHRGRVQDLAYVQPLCRYKPPGAIASPVVGAACVAGDENVHLYEPVVRRGQDLHPDTAPVVVPLDRIICEVPLLPDVASGGHIPAGANVSSLPGAVAANPQQHVPGSRLFHVQSLRLRWSRSKVRFFDPGRPWPEA